MKESEPLPPNAQMMERALDVHKEKLHAVGEGVEQAEALVEALRRCEAEVEALSRLPHQTQETLEKARQITANARAIIADLKRRGKALEGPLADLNAATEIVKNYRK